MNNPLEKSYFPSYTSSSLQTFYSSVPSSQAMLSSFSEAVASAGDGDQCTWGWFLHWQQLLQAAPCSSCSGKTLDPTPAQVSSSLFPPPTPLWTSFLLLLPPWPCFSFCLVYATVSLRHFKTQRCHRFPWGWARPCLRLGPLDPAGIDCERLKAGLVSPHRGQPCRPSTKTLTFMRGKIMMK